MTELRLISNEPGGGLATAPPPLPSPLPRGRHGLPADLVRATQRRRLIDAACAALAEQGYGRVTAARVTELAGVSSRTFYQHFEDLWACLLAAYESEAARLCEAIAGAVERARHDGLADRAATTVDSTDGRLAATTDEANGDGRRAADADSRRQCARAGIAAALEFLAAGPAPARLLSAEPPPQVAPLATARRDLIERLGQMLRAALDAGPTPLPGLERRLTGAALALIATRATTDPAALPNLEPELTDLLLASL